jgi:aspartyl-tRNA(Asn)/glutamyl-tRNA(Gln) amidotransferase subunit B
MTNNSNGTGYTMTIGLEIHAELKTKSKMFCGCANLPEDKDANFHTCPVCMGNPGTLPVINKQAVKNVLLVGTAVGGKIADFTEFDRKNYFYPDIPKGYQISQYKYPLVEGGSLNGVQLTRIHLEEDTARSSHDTPGVSLVDFNRAGVPLMELVTEAVIHSGEQATSFAKEFQLLLQSLDVSGANMEKGEMRVEVNFSVSKTEKFGTKVEVKNINSFRAVAKAIDFEFNRQTKLLDSGGVVVQETRGWDENKEITFSQRAKESAHDYRYFPEPDLPKLKISEIPKFAQAELKKLLPELPQQKRERFIREYNLKQEDVETYINNTEAMKFFEAISEPLSKKDGAVKLASNYITSDIIGLSKAMNADFALGKITPENFVKLITMISEGELSSRGAKDTLKIMFDDGGEPDVIAKEKGLIQKSDPEELKKVMQEIVATNPKGVEDYKNGKESMLQFFIGQGMKATKGSANPELLKTIALEILDK